MKRIMILILFYSGVALAQPDEIHSCLAWLTLYDQTHNDPKTHKLRTLLESEMKKSGVLNPLQLNEAYDDNLTRDTASSNNKDTKRTLSYCTKLASDFSR